MGVTANVLLATSDTSDTSDSTAWRHHRQRLLGQTYPRPLKSLVSERFAKGVRNA
jgi:hypothetical protein